MIIEKGFTLSHFILRLVLNKSAFSKSDTNMFNGSTIFVSDNVLVSPKSPKGWKCVAVRIVTATEADGEVTVVEYSRIQ